MAKKESVNYCLFFMNSGTGECVSKDISEILTRGLNGGGSKELGIPEESYKALIHLKSLIPEIVEQKRISANETKYLCGARNCSRGEPLKVAASQRKRCLISIFGDYLSETEAAGKVIDIKRNLE